MSWTVVDSICWIGLIDRKLFQGGFQTESNSSLLFVCAQGFVRGLAERMN
jgi:hypothetical protein